MKKLSRQERYTLNEKLVRPGTHLHQVVYRTSEELAVDANKSFPWLIDLNIYKQQQMIGFTYELFMYGDLFIRKNNKKFELLSAKKIFIAETTKGLRVEYQYGNEPDWSMLQYPIEKSSKEDLKKSRNLRLKPHEVIHVQLFSDKSQHYPYSRCLVEDIMTNDNDGSILGSVISGKRNLFKAMDNITFITEE
jgi:hypothetical protein